MEVKLTEERMDALRQRVMKGVELLDMAKPEWWKSIDLEAFDLQDCQKCVLGQLYGHYTDGCVELLGALVGFPTDQSFDPEQFGFEQPDDLKYDWLYEDEWGDTSEVAEFSVTDCLLDECGAIWANIITSRQSRVDP